MREHGDPAVHRRRAPPGGGVRPARGVVLDRARLHQPADRARPGRHPAARPPTAPTATRSWSPAATPRSTRSRSPTSSTRPCSATASRRRSRSPRSSGAGRTTGCPDGRDGLLTRLAVERRRLRPGVLRRDLPAGRPDPARRAEPPRRAVAGVEAHRHGPRRLAVPEGAAGAARRDGARALQRRDLPRLHPRLPVLPGRDDHPPGARAVDHHGRRDGAAGRSPRPASTRSGCCRCRAPTTARSARSRRGSPTATRASRSRCRCRRPGSTPST